MVDADFLTVQEALAGVYSLERELGRGGMGIVYLAREVWLDRLVALKVLPPALAARPDLRERFLREARTSAQLSHPNIVPILQVDERDDLVYFAMSYIDGGTLGERVRKFGPLRTHEAARVLRDVALALSYGHAHGVIHRDVKPDNILLDEQSGRAVVSDFGIAMVTEGAAEGGGADGEILGTAQYVSPEQATGGAVDGRSDLYSLGVVAFFALTGTLPFEGRTSRELVAHHIGTPAPPVGSVEPGVPVDLADAVDRCLEKDPDRRPATCEEFARLIDHATIASERPVAIRAWLAHSSKGVSAVLSAGAILSAVYLNDFSSPFQMWRSLALDGVLLFLPLAWTGLMRSRATQRLLATGYTFDDMRTALAEASAEDSRTIARDISAPIARDRFAWRIADPATPPTAERRIARLLSIATGTVAAAAGAAAFTIAARGTSMGEVWLFELYDAAFRLFVAAAPAFALSLAVSADRVSFTRLAGATRISFERLRLRFWQSSFAERLFTPLRGKRNAGTPFAGPEPTEMAIGSAANLAYHALPETARRELGDVPAVVSQLDREARDIRDRLAAIDAALTSTDDLSDDAVESRALLLDAWRTAERHLHMVVGALENLRLGLVRMQANHRDMGSLTTDLASAAQISRDVDAAVTGYATVSELLAADTAPGAAPPIDVEQHEPTPV